MTLVEKIKEEIMIIKLQNILVENIKSIHNKYKWNKLPIK